VCQARIKAATRFQMEMETVHCLALVIGKKSGKVIAAHLPTKDEKTHIWVGRRADNFPMCIIEEKLAKTKK
jgi:hypothetical protein